MISSPSSVRRRALRTAIAVISILMLSGCVQHIENGKNETFQYEFWVPLVALLAGIVATPVGWILRNRAGRFAWALLIGGPLAAFLLAPSLYCDQVRVTDDSIHVQTGIWGMTAVHDVKLDDVQTLKIISETSTTRRGGKRTNYFFLCERKSGDPVKFPMNNAVARAAASAMLERVTERGIPVVDQTEQ